MAGGQGGGKGGRTGDIGDRNYALVKSVVLCMTETCHEQLCNYVSRDDSIKMCL